MAEAKDKRAASREPVHFVAELVLDDQHIGCGVSRNASGNGLLLLTHLGLAVGQEVLLRLYVPGENEPRTLRATIARSESIGVSEGLVWAYRAGVHFAEPPRDLQTVIENLTRRRESAAPEARR